MTANTPHRVLDCNFSPHNKLDCFQTKFPTYLRVRLYTVFAIKTQYKYDEFTNKTLID